MKRDGCHRRILLSALLLLLPLPTLAQDSAFEGDWAAGDPLSCDMSGSDSENFALRIRGNQFRGLETECRMTNPLTVPGIGGVLYDMDCTGEGDQWNYRAFFMIDRDGRLVMIADGSARTYPRCEGYVRPQPDQTSAPGLPEK